VICIPAPAPSPTAAGEQWPADGAFSCFEGSTRQRPPCAARPAGAGRRNAARWCCSKRRTRLVELLEEPARICFAIDAQLLVGPGTPKRHEQRLSARWRRPMEHFRQVPPRGGNAPWLLAAPAAPEAPQWSGNELRAELGGAGSGPQWQRRARQLARRNRLSRRRDLTPCSTSHAIAAATTSSQLATVRSPTAVRITRGNCFGPRAAASAPAALQPRWAACLLLLILCWLAEPQRTGRCCSLALAAPCRCPPLFWWASALVVGVDQGGQRHRPW